jgi:hypothetical protein
MSYGNKATDGGFILEKEEKERLLLKEPSAESLCVAILGPKIFLMEASGGIYGL